ncbi:hypothetical protein ABEV34_09410 [Methylorubrum rhodesianum]|jgi:hypothetical protein|uniref:Uncharacterized protein n=1 Tax=Methylorubrum rhodesianum TaxID=29427 RepID=A0ABU9Z9T7_9HYPH|nr:MULTISPECIES: hypothetical protein [Methylorubrum]MBY0142428.1 hypothetical protein [Methylorubrum populi]MRI53493.1 hypothetical protein [Methylobacterium sp. DB1607]MBB5762629.1 hypothetical protein [Methylorubrum rhodesianum]MBI1688533.1 hypothetical protein [Methylorubrum sp. DB1722]MBK3402423.1 hypothetical protein [Methylorubrum rhodesianum]
MAATLTVGELFKAKAVTDEQVSAAVETYLTKPKTSAHPIADGYTVDLGAAVARHGWARRLMASPKTNPLLKRAAVQTAILLARVKKVPTRVKRDRPIPPAEP